MLISGLRIPYLKILLFISLIIVLITISLSFALNFKDSEIHDGRMFTKYSDRKIFKLQADSTDKVYFTSRSGGFIYNKPAGSLKEYNIGSSGHFAVPVKFFKSSNGLFILCSDGSVYDADKNSFLLKHQPLLSSDGGGKLLYEDSEYRYVHLKGGGLVVQNKGNGSITPMDISHYIKPERLNSSFNKEKEYLGSILFPEDGLLAFQIDNKSPGIYKDFNSEIIKKLNLISPLQMDKYYPVGEVVRQSSVRHNVRDITELNKAKSFIQSLVFSDCQDARIKKFTTIDDTVVIAGSSGISIFAKNGSSLEDRNPYKKLNLDLFKDGFNSAVEDFSLDYKNCSGIARVSNDILLYNLPGSKGWENLFYNSEFKGLPDTRFASYSKESGIFTAISDRSIGLYDIHKRKWISAPVTYNSSDNSNNKDILVKDTTIYKNRIYLICRKGSSTNFLFTADLSEFYKALSGEVSFSTATKSFSLEEDTVVIPGTEPVFIDKRYGFYRWNNNILGKRGCKDGSADICGGDPGQIKECYEKDGILYLLTTRGFLFSYDSGKRSLTMIENDVIKFLNEKAEVFQTRDKDQDYVSIKSDEKGEKGNKYIRHTLLGRINDIFTANNFLFALSDNYLWRYSFEEKKFLFFFNPLPKEVNRNGIFCSSGKNLFIFDPVNGKLFRYDADLRSWSERSYNITFDEKYIINSVRDIYVTDKGILYVLMSGSINGESCHSIVVSIDTNLGKADFIYRGNNIEKLPRDIVRAVKEGDTLLILTAGGKLMLFSSGIGYWYTLKDERVKDFACSGSNLAVLSNEGVLNLYYIKSGTAVFVSAINNVNRLFDLKGDEIIFGKGNSIVTGKYTGTEIQDKKILFSGGIRSDNPDEITVSALKGEEDKLWHINCGEDRFYYYNLSAGNIERCGTSSVYDTEKYKFFDGGSAVYRFDGRNIVTTYMFIDNAVKKSKEIKIENSRHLSFLSSADYKQTGFLNIRGDHDKTSGIDIYMNVMDSPEFNPAVSIDTPVLSDYDDTRTGSLIVFDGFFKHNLETLQTPEKEGYNSILIFPGREILINLKTMQSCMVALKDSMYNDRGNIDSIKNKGIFLVNGFYYYINKDGYIEKYSGELKGDFFSVIVMQIRSYFARPDDKLCSMILGFYREVQKNYRSIKFSADNNTPVVSAGNYTLNIKRSTDGYRVNWSESIVDNPRILNYAGKQNAAGGLNSFSFGEISRTLTGSDEGFKFSCDVLRDLVTDDRGLVVDSAGGFRLIPYNNLYSVIDEKSFSMDDFRKIREEKHNFEKSAINRFLTDWFDRDTFINRAYAGSFKVNGDRPELRMEGPDEKIKSVYKLTDRRNGSLLDIVNSYSSGNVTSAIKSDYTDSPWNGKCFFIDNTMAMTFKGGSIIAKFLSRENKEKYIYAENPEAGVYDLPEYCLSLPVSESGGKRFYSDDGGLFFIDGGMNRVYEKNIIWNIADYPRFDMSINKNLTDGRVVFTCSGREIKNVLNDYRFFTDSFIGGGVFSFNNREYIYLAGKDMVQVGIDENNKFKMEGCYIYSSENEKPAVRNNFLYLLRDGMARSLSTLNSGKIGWSSDSVNFREIDLKIVPDIIFSPGKSRPEIADKTIGFSEKTPFFINGRDPSSYIYNNRFFFDSCTGITPWNHYENMHSFIQYTGTMGIEYEIDYRSDKELRIKNVIESAAPLTAQENDYPGVRLRTDWSSSLYGMITDILCSDGEYLYCSCTNSRDEIARISFKDGSLSMIRMSKKDLSEKNSNALGSAEPFGWRLKNNRIFYLKSGRL